MTRQAIERFMLKVDHSGECHLWTASLRNGYGQFNDGTTIVRAHRWIWEYHHGSIPPGLVVMHQCDNRACVRIEHLSLGTQAQNLADASAKGRLRTSEATKQLQRAGNVGRVRSCETRRRMSESAKRRRARTEVEI